MFTGDIPAGHVVATIDEQNLWFREISRDEYAAVADAVVADGDVAAVMDEFVQYYEYHDQHMGEGKSRKYYPVGKLMFLVARMMQLGDKAESMDPATAQEVMRERIEKVHVPRILGWRED